MTLMGSAPELLPDAFLLKEKARSALEAAKRLDSSKNQTSLAQRVGLSTSAVNKILTSPNSHPMTLPFAVALADFVGRSLDDIFASDPRFVEEEARNAPQENTEAPQDIFDQSLSELSRHFARTGVEIRRLKLFELADRVANAVENTDRLPEDFASAITKLTAEQTARG